MKYLLLLFLTIPIVSYSQLEIKTGFGYGYILGSYYRGNSIIGEVDYNFSKRFSIELGGCYFYSSQRKYYKIGSYGPTILESTLSNPIPILNTDWDKQQYDNGLIKSRSELDKTVYTEVSLKIGYSLVNKERSNLKFYIGPSFAKYDRVFNPTIIDATIDIGPFGIWNATLYSTAYVSYWDLGYSAKLEYNKFIYKNLFVGLSMTANKYFWSRDGFWYGALKVGATIN